MHRGQACAIRDLLLRQRKIEIAVPAVTDLLEADHELAQQVSDPRP
jgi:hypothetical protein